MARDRHRDLVFCARTADRARRSGGADCLSDFGVALCFSGGDRLKRFPHAHLESGAADIEWKFDCALWSFDESDDARDCFIERRRR